MKPIASYSDSELLFLCYNRLYCDHTTLHSLPLSRAAAVLRRLPVGHYDHSLAVRDALCVTTSLAVGGLAVGPKKKIGKSDVRDDPAEFVCW